MKKALFTFGIAALLSIGNAFGASIRIDSVLLHETFETTSPTITGWSVSIPTTGSCSTQWTFATNSGSGALGSDRYAAYPASQAFSGCYSVLYSPEITTPSFGTDDSLVVDFYMYRESVSTSDNIQVSVIDANGSVIVGPAEVYVAESQNPTSGPGWDALTWGIKLSDITSSVPSGKVFIQFQATSGGGGSVNILLDEVTIHHIYQLPQFVTIASPAKGDTIASGSTTSIAWSSQGLKKVDLFYSNDGGSTYSKITGQNAISGSYSWTVPSVEVASAYFKIADSVNGTTNAIVGPVAIAWPEKLVTFTGGESVMGGSHQTIAWRSRPPVSTMKIDYSTDGGTTWTNITNVNSPNGVNNSYVWQVPNVVSSTALIRLTDDNNMTVQSLSDFTITHNTSIAPVSDEIGLQCYPNPAHGDVLVKFQQELNESSELNVYDIKGIRLSQVLLAAGSMQTTLDMHSLTPGVYFIELKNNESITKQKVVIY